MAKFGCDASKAKGDPFVTLPSRATKVGTCDGTGGPGWGPRRDDCLGMEERSTTEDERGTVRKREDD